MLTQAESDTSGDTQRPHNHRIQPTTRPILDTDAALAESAASH